MKRFLSVVGNRPQLIKLDPEFDQTIIFTGQHYDKEMKDVFFDGLDIPKPDEDLGETELGAMIDKLLEVIPKYSPEYVLIYGDTRSSVAGTLAAHQLGIPIIHVEAGCRSGNKKQIEERNRILIDKLSTIHLCPSLRAVYRLEDEGLGDNAYNIGATNFSTLLKTLPTVKPEGEPYSILTIHRAENVVEDRLKEIFKGLATADHQIIFPIHPRTKKFIKDKQIPIPDNILVVAPMAYKQFVSTMGHAKYVITDSGGAQTEAYFLRTPCITLREETEWGETVEEDWNRLVGHYPDRIADVLKKFKPFKQQHQTEAYGRGQAHKIMKAILQGL